MAAQAVSIEYNDQPRLLLIADTPAGEERGRRSALAAGCRIAAAVGLEEGLRRLVEAGADGVLVEIERDGGQPLDSLIEELERQAHRHARPSVVCTTSDVIDIVAARAPSPLVQHLCDASEAERIIAIALATAPRRPRLHDVGGSDRRPGLNELSRDAERIAAFLAALADREARGDQALTLPPDGELLPVDAALVRSVIRARRLRDRYFGTDLFADPAWDMMLDLLAARLEGHRVAVSSLCIAAAVPPTTALRWIKSLTDQGLLVRTADPQDGRRIHVELSDEAAGGLQAYLRAAQRVSPLLL
jgi:DNA-binding transcriptional ArsR family regulator